MTSLCHADVAMSAQPLQISREQTLPCSCNTKLKAKLWLTRHGPALPCSKIPLSSKGPTAEQQGPIWNNVVIEEPFEAHLLDREPILTWVVVIPMLRCTLT